MDSITLTQLWTAAGVLTGFQFAALSWRIRRETEMEAEGEITWLTMADLVAGLSFLVLVLGVFVAPILGIITENTIPNMFGLALVLFVSYPFILAGHYNLYCSWGKIMPDPSKPSKCECNSGMRRREHTCCDGELDSNSSESVCNEEESGLRGRVTKQEVVAFVCGLVLYVGYLAYWWTS